MIERGVTRIRRLESKLIKIIEDGWSSLKRQKVKWERSEISNQKRLKETFADVRLHKLCEVAPDESN